MDRPYADAPDVLAATLGVDPRRGLDEDEVARRRAASGPNALEHAERPSVLHMVVEAATEPFVLLLLAAGVGAVLLGEVRDGLLILAGLIPIVGADVVTEYRGERALEALRDATAPRATVRRDGGIAEVAATDLVPGDVVLVRVGDVVPADLRLVRAEGLVVDRSVLTGESLPEPAALDAVAPDTPLADRRSMAYSGTSVVAGRAEGIVVAIGSRTEVGQIAGGLTTRERRRSPLQRELARLVRILLVVAVGLIAITSGLGFLRGNPIGQNLLAGISAAIAAIPEEPPVLLAVILGLGAYRLLRRGVLVRRLNAEEVLGAVDLIVTDKTGTLTQNRLEVASLADLDGPVTGERRQRMLVDAYRAEEDVWQEVAAGVGSFSMALARAIEASGAVVGLDPADLVAADPVHDERPFTRTVARRDGVVETLVLGAPEAVADLVLGRTGAERETWHQIIETAVGRGERAVALARRLDDGPWAMEAIIGFADTLRPGIVDAVTQARTAGIHVVMVTGDHPGTARTIAEEAGLGSTGVVVGSEVAAWGDDVLAAQLPNLVAIARSTPDLKRRVVECARASGRLVAVTGDGVNDAPALHHADVAVAMGSGTAVAREASDLVLGDDSFATLVFGIAEGRRIVDNVQKGLVFLVSTHVALLGFLLIATLAGFSQPLIPIQILWLELFIDTSTPVAFEREPPEPELMTRPPRRVGHALLTRGLLGRITIAGGFSALAALGLLTGAIGGSAHGQWLACTALVCAQAVRAYANRSLTQPLWRLSPNGLLLAACIAVVAVQAAIPLVPPLADAFRAVPLTLPEWGLVALIALIPALVAEVVRSTRRVTWVA